MMGGCCCHDDNQDDDQEEKCVIVNNEEHPLSPKKEYGTVAIAAEKNESSHKEHLAPNPENDNNCSHDSKGMLMRGVASANDVSEIGKTSREILTHNHSANCIAVDEDESPSDVSRSMDREIDELVEAAMAAEVIYPPPANPELDLSVPKSPSKTALHKHVSSKTSQESRNQDSASDPEADNGQDVSPTAPVPYKKKAFPRAKARAITMVPMSSRSSDDRLSVHDKGTSPKRKKGPGERMQSRYAKDRVARAEVERDVKEKLASHRAANDPRKAALERGERLGRLDDTIDEMRDHSSSFAQVARQLRDDQRGRTSTFPW